MTVVRFAAEAGNFSLRHRFQTGSRAHPASYQWVRWGSFSGIKQSERKADHLLPSSTEVKNEWSYTSIPSYVQMTRCLGKDRIRLHDVVFK
jgi:hypothetical protein